MFLSFDCNWGGAERPEILYVHMCLRSCRAENVKFELGRVILCGAKDLQYDLRKAEKLMHLLGLLKKFSCEIRACFIFLLNV